MVKMTNLKFTDHETIWYYNGGVAMKMRNAFRANGIPDDAYYLAPISMAIRDGKLPEGTRPPKKSWLDSPGQPVRLGRHMWVLISHIDTDSLNNRRRILVTSVMS